MWTQHNNYHLMNEWMNERRNENANERACISACAIFSLTFNNDNSVEFTAKVNSSTLPISYGVLLWYFHHKFQTIDFNETNFGSYGDRNWLAKHYFVISLIGKWFDDVLEIRSKNILTLCKSFINQKDGLYFFYWNVHKFWIEVYWVT